MMGCKFVSTLMLAASLSSGCSVLETDTQPVANGDAQEVGCALNNAADMSRDCRLEIVNGEDGETIYVVRHPDGGFRRFIRDPETSALRAYDGADLAEYTITAESENVKIGDSNYRFSIAEAGGRAAEE